jgi:hypothetical protein
VDHPYVVERVPRYVNGRLNAKLAEHESGGVLPVWSSVSSEIDDITCAMVMPPYSSRNANRSTRRHGSPASMYVTLMPK